MHIHVAIDGPDKAIKVMNGLLPQLAPLLALSASSPFWRGEPTGLMSSRQMVFSSFPRSGPPPRFRDYADYAKVVRPARTHGCIADYTHIWWDIRPHPRLGTIEIRICDAVTRSRMRLPSPRMPGAVKQLSEDTMPARRSPATTGSDHREQIAGGALRASTTGDRSRHGTPQSDPSRPARTSHCVSSNLMHGSSGRSASWRASASFSHEETAPTGSSGSSTRTATSARWSRRSRSRPRRCRSLRPDAPAGRFGAGGARVESATRKPDPAGGGAGRPRPGVLRFYPFDWSPGCTNEALFLRERKPELDAAGVRPFGISRDSPWSHAAWVMTLGVETVPLLADWAGEATLGFGVARELDGMANVAARSAFLIDDDTVESVVAPRRRPAGYRRHPRGCNARLSAGPRRCGSHSVPTSPVR